MTGNNNFCSVCQPKFVNLFEYWLTTVLYRRIYSIFKMQKISQAIHENWFAYVCSWIV